MLVEQWRANFWNPEWEGVKLPREMHRFLLATFKKASEEFAEGKVAEMDGGEVEAGDVEMAVAEGGMDAPAAGATGTDLAMPAPTSAAPPSEHAAAARKRGAVSFHNVIALTMIHVEHFTFHGRTPQNASGRNPCASRPLDYRAL